MKAQELIKLLQALPEDAEIGVRGYEGGYDKATSIKTHKVVYDPRSFEGDYRPIYTDEDEEPEFIMYELSAF